MKRLVTILMLAATASAFASFDSNMKVVDIRVEIKSQRNAGHTLTVIVKEAMKVGIKPKMLMELLQEQGYHKDAITAAILANGGDPTSLLESTSSGQVSNVEGFKFTPAPTLGGGGQHSVSKS
jgi:hypothetical protein